MGSKCLQSVLTPVQYIGQYCICKRFLIQHSLDSRTNSFCLKLSPVNVLESTGIKGSIRFQPKCLTISGKNMMCVRCLRVNVQMQAKFQGKMLWFLQSNSHSPEQAAYPMTLDFKVKIILHVTKHQFRQIQAWSAQSLSESLGVATELSF